VVAWVTTAATVAPAGVAGGGDGADLAGTERRQVIGLQIGNLGRGQRRNPRRASIALEAA